MHDQGLPGQEVRKQANKKPCDGVHFALSGTGSDRPRLRGVEEQLGCVDHRQGCGRGGEGGSKGRRALWLVACRLR